MLYFALEMIHYMDQIIGLFSTTIIVESFAEVYTK
jgi:hypothetical protein